MAVIKSSHSNIHFIVIQITVCILSLFSRVMSINLSLFFLAGYEAGGARASVARLVGVGACGRNGWSHRPGRWTDLRYHAFSPDCGPGFHRGPALPRRQPQGRGAVDQGRLRSGHPQGTTGLWEASVPPVTWALLTFRRKWRPIYSVLTFLKL